jgi:hypothetical protein
MEVFERLEPHRMVAHVRFLSDQLLSAVSFARLEASQRADQPQAPFSMASLKRRYFNQHLVDRILDHFATEGAHPLVF